MNFVKQLVVRAVLFLINILIQVVHIPHHVNNFLKDHVQTYRKLRGGVWLKWNGFWEKVDADSYAIVRRGYVGLDLAEGALKWSWNQGVKLGDSVIAAVEDYTQEKK